MGAVVTGNKIEFTANPTLPYTSNGVTWTSPSSNHFKASGTATANSILYFHNQYAMPSWLEFDKQYNVYFPKTGNTNNVVFIVQLQRNSDLSWYTAYFNYRESGTFTVPTEAQGYRQIVVCLRLSNGYTANETVYPYLMKVQEYVPRLSEFKPTRIRRPNNPYYWDINYNPYAYPGNYMPNCTTYAWGRWVELMGGNIPTSDLGRGNGGDWFGRTNPNGIYTKVAYGDPNCIPRLGAIACFGGGDYGHVAIVEKIYDNGDVLFSNSGLHYDFFYLRCGNISSGYRVGKRGRIAYPNRTFQGFIYLPDDYSPVPTPEPYSKPMPLWFWTRRKPF